MEETKSQQSLKDKFFTKKIILAVTGILVVIIMITIGYILYSENNKKANQKRYQKSESELILDEVAKMIDLPSGEEPTIANVTDSTKLKTGQDTSFFQKAENGDKVLVFTKAQKAILYRPTSHKIIEIANVNLENDASTSAQASGSGEIKPTAYSFVIYNGAGVNGLAKKMEDEVIKINSQNTVVKKENAQKSDYTESILIDLTNLNGGDTKKLSEALGLKIGQLPAGENKPNGGQFLIIVGRDKATN